MTLQLEVAVTNKIYSYEEYLELADDGNRYELVEGELEEMSQPGDEHAKITFGLGRKMADFVDEQALGEVWVGAGFRLAEKTVRAPDIMFVQASRVQPKTKGPVQVIPDLAVEVISPNDDWSKIVEKVREYQGVGVRLIWLIDPNLQGVFIFHQDDKLPGIIDGQLDGETVVPGFKLAIAKLFE
jgi:Uma2 family endonuclease